MSYKLSEKILSQSFIAKSAGVEIHSLRTNIRLLLRMMLKKGYTMNKVVAEKMNRETIKARKYGRFQ